ncbi:MAG: NAD(P)/FAD-dependent oxidoreductase, partial [Gemmatales bacterium]|nr:NAD(P)/FAD-dependent oxidoreductase [Gemmatales bacterium]MDW8388455.1 NAD(P)/FAD-dependent oxidoreductase [Gemmatales bacterium]
LVGAGHNGLVAAAYLAKAGWRVLVLERRHVVGGACVTEELWPGFKVSSASYVNSLFRPEIIRDLDLKRHGLEMLPRNPSSFTPLPDGRYLLLGPEAALNRQEIAKFSSRDAEAFPRYEAMLERAAAFLEPLLLRTPPDPWSNRLWDLWELAQLGLRFAKLGKDGRDVVDILTNSARAILDRWFECDVLKATLATDAVIGAMASPSTPGTAYVLFHHVMGECNGARGVWCYVRGGMGGIAQALGKAAQQYKAEIRCEAEVREILVRDGKAVGVVLADGSEIASRVVVSNVDAATTFLKLLNPKLLPEDFVSEVRKIDYSSASLKINVALAELPNFRAMPGSTSGPHHRGTIHICPSLEYMERAFDDAKYGQPSQNPILECTIPSVVDPTVAPEGKHVMSLFVQYAPYALREKSWDEIKDSFADRCFAILDQYAPNFSRSVLHRQVLLPLDLERTFGLTGGNIFQGAMTLGQLFFLRPVPGWAKYRTPIRGLYLCGAATHPGGGVMGACGYNAAREILRDGKG